MAVTFQSQNPTPRNRFLPLLGWLCVAFGSVPVLFVAFAVAFGVL